MTKTLETKEGLFRGEFGRSTLEIKEITEAGEFEGYAAVFGNVDDGGDVLVSGCFAGSLIATPATRVKMLWQHDPSCVIGRYSEMREDAKGLWCAGKLNLKIQKAAEAYELLKDGAIDGLSIGYRTTKDDVDRQMGVRRLLAVDLKEVSVVTFPMNGNALVQRVKSGNLPTEREIEDILMRDAGLSSKMAKAFIAGGYKKLRPEREAGEGDEAVYSALEDLTRMLRA